MKLTHYPVQVVGLKSAACISEHTPTWKLRIISIKISHRKGQSIKVKVDCRATVGIYNYWVDNYENYTAVRIVVLPEYFISQRDMINGAVKCITNVTKYINFDAPEALVTKELYNAFK